MPTFLALLVLAFVLPFEVRLPLFAIGPIVITNTELVAYLTCAIGLIEFALTRNRVRPPAALTWALIGWLGVMAISALAARTHQAEALKFTLRSTSGVVLCLVSAVTLTSPARVAVLAAALAAGAAASALVGIVDVWLPGSPEWLWLFRDQPSLVGGQMRATGTFDYANTAGMFWEAVTALTVAGGARLASLHRSRLSRLLTAAAVVVLALGIVLTLSRAAIAATAVSLAGLTLIGHRLARPLRSWSGLALASLVAFALASPISTTVFLRFATTAPSEWYRPDYDVTPAASTAEAGARLHVRLAVRNAGQVTWRAEGPEHAALTYFWSDAEGDRPAIFSGVRLPLPRDVPPGDAIAIDTAVSVPQRPGRYELHWDMVIETVVWFSGLGADTGVATITVTGESDVTAPSRSSGDAIVPPAPRPDRRQLWTSALAFWRTRPWLGVGPDSFRHLHPGTIAGVAPDNRTHANSLYLEALVNTGLLGLAALLGLMTATALLARRAWRQATSIDDRMLLAGVVAGVAAFFLHGLVDYFWSFAPTAGLFWLLLGALGGLVTRRQPASS